jgi:hypothetical protein
MHHRDRHQPAIDYRVEIVILDAALHDDADVETGAAHVGGDDVAQARLQHQMLAGRDAGHRAGMHGLQCVGRVQLGHAAGVVIDQHRLVVALRAQVELERAETVIHGRVQEGVHDRRHRARVFALAAGDLVAQQQRNRAEQMARIFLEENLTHAQFVGRVDDAVGEGDHQRFGAGVDQFTNALTHVVLVELPENLAEIVDALAHFANHLDRHDRLGALRVRDVDLAFFRQAFAVAACARQRNRALEAGGHQRADARALALDQRIGAERGRVTHRIHLRQQRSDFDFQLFAGIGQRLVEAEREVVMRGQRLALDVAIAPADEAIGEGAADVYGNSFHGFNP